MNLTQNISDLQKSIETQNIIQAQETKQILTSIKDQKTYQAIIDIRKKRGLSDFYKSHARFKNKKIKDIQDFIKSGIADKMACDVLYVLYLLESLKTGKTIDFDTYETISEGVVTTKNIKTMISFMNKIVQSFPTISVAEGLVEFTERRRVLTSGTSARPGPYRFSVTPYTREITECLSEYSNITEVVNMKPTQWAGTNIMMNHQLYCIEYGIGPVLYVTSDDELASEFMEKRFDPMVAAAKMQDCITPPVQKKANKASGDTKRAKSYKGTFIKAIGARSESKLSSVPVRIVHLDEVDKYPVALAGGGDSSEKAIRRSDTYENLRKIFYNSTPKKKATSRIGPLFRQGDMRYYHIPCPECGHMQRLLWDQMIWDKTEDGKLDLQMDDHGHVTNDCVWHECANKECKYKMRDHEKIYFMRERGHGGKAEWRPSKKPDRPGLRSYHGNGMEGFRSWINIILQWQNIEGDPILLQDFVNDVLGEEYEDKIDKPDEHYLASRAETDWNRGDINEHIKTLTMGVDVQGDRLECALMGWTEWKESWAVEYYVFPGNTNDPNDDCYNYLDEIIRQDFVKPSGEVLRIQVCLIDAPFETASVMNFCERFPYYQNGWRGVYPAFGKQTLSQVVKEHTSTISTPEILADDQRLKFEIYTNLKRKTPAAGHAYPPGFIHFPNDYSEEYYKQMVAEEVTKITNNKGVETVFISNTKQRRNEVLDTTKLALAGLYRMYLKYFEVLNVNRKARKRKEIRPSWQIFWDLFEGEEITEESEKKEDN